MNVNIRRQGSMHCDYAVRIQDDETIILRIMIMGIGWRNEKLWAIYDFYGILLRIWSDASPMGFYVEEAVYIGEFILP